MYNGLLMKLLTKVISGCDDSGYFCTADYLFSDERTKFKAGPGLILTSR